MLVVAARPPINPHCTRRARRHPLSPTGKPIHELTLAQIKTLDCGSKRSGLPRLGASPARRCRRCRRSSTSSPPAATTHVRFNIETKISPPVDDTVALRRVHGQARQGDPGQPPAGPRDDPVLRLAHDPPGQAARPAIETVALVWQYAGADCDDIDDECSLRGRHRRPVGHQPVDRRPGLVAVPRPRPARARRQRRRRVRQLAGPRPDQGTVDSADSYLKEDPAIYHGPPVPALQRGGCASCPTRSTTRRRCSA